MLTNSDDDTHLGNLVILNNLLLLLLYETSQVFLDIFNLGFVSNKSDGYCLLQLNEGFTFKEENLICHACRGITPSKVCDACGNDFAPGQKKVGYQSKTFHENCFVCDECKQPIGSKQFIRREDKRLCGGCFDTSYAKVK